MIDPIPFVVVILLSGAIGFVFGYQAKKGSR